MSAVESLVAVPVPSDSATMTDLSTASPSPPPLAPSSPPATTTTITTIEPSQQPHPQLTPLPNQPPTPLQPSPDPSPAPYRYGRPKLGPTSKLHPNHPHHPTTTTPTPTPAPAPHLRYLVIALGSTTLRYGTADEFQPRAKAMVVAYRRIGRGGEAVGGEAVGEEDGRRKLRKRTGAGGGVEERHSREGRRDEKKEQYGTVAEERKDQSEDVEMRDERKEAQEQRSSASAAGQVDVSAQIAAWHQQAGADFAALNAEVIKRRVQPPPKPKFFDEYDPVPVYEEGGPTTTVTLATDDTPWTNVDYEPSYVTGDAALDLHPDAPYTVFFPIRRGRFNVSYTPFAGSIPASAPPCPNSSYTACLTAIEHLLSDTLMNDFHIPASSFHMYSLVLSLPSTLTSRNVYDIADICFMRLGLKELFIHHSSVLATYGCGLPLACLVHAGGQTTRVVCVDEGLELPGSSVVLERGGDEVGEVLLAYMKHHDHYMQPAIRRWQVHDSIWQWRQVQRAKDKVLTATTREFHYQWVEFREPVGDGAVRVYRMNASLWDVGGGVVLDVVMDDIVRQSVFYAFTAEYERTADQQRRPIWEQVRKQAEGQAEATTTAGAATEGADERKEEGGPLMDAMGERPKKKKKKRRDEAQEVEEAAVDFALPTTNPALLNNPSSTSPIRMSAASSSQSAASLSTAASSATGPPLSLAQAIAASINSVASISRRRRLCLTILLTGSSFAVPGVADWATQWLAGQLPPLMLSTLTPNRDAGEEVQCAVGGKMVGIGCESWKGAAVVAGIRMEALGSGGKDKWMSRDEWQRNPTRTLREKCPFVI